MYILGAYVGRTYLEAKGRPPRTDHGGGRPARAAMTPEPLPRPVEALSPAQDSDFPRRVVRASAAPDHFWFEWRLAGDARASSATCGLALDRAPARARRRRGRRRAAGSARGGARAWTIDIDRPATPPRCAGRRPGRGRTLCYDVTAPDAAPLAGSLRRGRCCSTCSSTSPSRRPSCARSLAPPEARAATCSINVPAWQWLCTAPTTPAAGHVRRYDQAVAARPSSRDTGLEISALRYWGLPARAAGRSSASGACAESTDRAQTIRAGIRPARSPRERGAAVVAPGGDRDPCLAPRSARPCCSPDARVLWAPSPR